MSLQLVDWAADWPLVLPYFDGRVPAGFPSPAEDYLENPLDLTKFLIDNKAATFLMRVDGIMDEIFRNDRLQQLLRLLRACVSARPRRRSAHRALKQRLVSVLTGGGVPLVHRD